MKPLARAQSAEDYAFRELTPEAFEIAGDAYEAAGKSTPAKRMRELAAWSAALLSIDVAPSPWSFKRLTNARAYAKRVAGWSPDSGRGERPPRYGVRLMGERLDRWRAQQLLRQLQMHDEDEAIVIEGALSLTYPPYVSLFPLVVSVVVRDPAVRQAVIAESTTRWGISLFEPSFFQATSGPPPRGGRRDVWRRR